MTQAQNVVTALLSHVLYVRVSLVVVDAHDETKSERCNTFVSIGKFATASKLAEWESRFRTACASHDIQIVESWPAQYNLSAERKVDYDPNIEYGSAEEVASLLHSFVPEKQRHEIGQWLSLMGPPSPLKKIA